MDFREKMAGENLYDKNLEGAFEPWFERIHPGRHQRSFHRYQGRQHKDMEIPRAVKECRRNPEFRWYHGSLRSALSNLLGAVFYLQKK